MPNPKITIITICFNSEAHIEEAILSVVSQSYLNKEYVIIDGGSTDGTLDIIARYKDRIDYFVSEPDRGISDAFNKGIKVATGDLIGIINSDDILEAGALEILASHYQEDIDVYRGLCGMFNDKTHHVFYDKPTMNWPALPLEMHVAHPSTFISSQAYKKYGLYDITLKYAMDFDILRRFEILHAKKLFIDKPLTQFRLGGASQSSDKKRLQELLQILKKNGSNWWQLLIFNAYYRTRLMVKYCVETLFSTNYRIKLANKI